MALPRIARLLLDVLIVFLTLVPLIIPVSVVQSLLMGVLGGAQLIALENVHQEIHVMLDFVFRPHQLPPPLPLSPPLPPLPLLPLFQKFNLAMVQQRWFLVEEAGVSVSERRASEAVSLDLP